MKERTKLVLVGFMGSGKSTVGRLVAAREGLRFVDLDREIENDAGKSCAALFRDEGEPAFRARESAALLRVLALDDVVIATGGGAACQEDNLRAMLAEALVVTLAVAPDEVLRRVGAGSGRPLLDGAEDPLAAAGRLLTARASFYARAHVTVDTTGQDPPRVADEVIQVMRAARAKRSENDRSHHSKEGKTS